jgi:putative pyruvate formate lyase activating enzyme
MPTVGQKLFASGDLEQRARQARESLQSCELCPRHCRVNRLEEELGICRIGAKARIASYSPHFGEEQPLVGRSGSGTIFLSGCNLHCCFCQNYDISHYPESGIEVDAKGFAAIMLDLQGEGCCNINFVSPSHVVPQILEALLHAYDSDLHLPLVYNSSGYETSETLALLGGVIDIYMPDFKFWSAANSKKYCAAPDYPEIARSAIKIMFEQVGDLFIDAKGIAVKGLLIRHLLMPEARDETEQILEFIAQQLSATTYLNIMDQYRPCGRSSEFQELQSTVSPQHYRQALVFAEKVGLTRLDQRNFETFLRRLIIT